MADSQKKEKSGGTSDVVDATFSAFNRRQISGMPPRHA
jgi:hypothetical protein